MQGFGKLLWRRAEEQPGTVTAPPRAWGGRGTTRSASRGGGGRGVTRSPGKARKAMTNLDSLLKSRDITLPTKAYISKSYGFFLVLMNGWESSTIKKVEC